MIKFIEKGDETLTAVKKILESKSYKEEDLIALSDASLKAPIPQPKKNVICIGKNYKDHIAEVKKADANQVVAGSTS